MRPRARLVFALASAVLFACVVTATASASEIVTRNPSHVRIKVDRKGRAVVYYKRGGERSHVLFWGAKNARTPKRDRAQIHFEKDYSGGWGAFRRPIWKTIRNRCRPYDGPSLPWFVLGCKAPDGSYWALQSWRRMLPDQGYRPWKSSQRVRELHLSHFTGKLARLEVHTDWVQGGIHHLFGRLTYRGKGVYGFAATDRGNPTDGYGRNVYLDTLNAPSYGSGWRRENSFLAHRKAGNFCYGFYARKTYYRRFGHETRPPGNGERYRLTAIGPGVTPDVRAKANGLPDFDPYDPDLAAYEERMNDLNRDIAEGDTSSSPCVAQ